MKAGKDKLPKNAVEYVGRKATAKPKINVHLIGIRVPDKWLHSLEQIQTAYYEPRTYINKTSIFSFLQQHIAELPAAKRAKIAEHLMSVLLEN